jgi:hypothetical protein
LNVCFEVDLEEGVVVLEGGDVERFGEGLQLGQTCRAEQSGGRRRRKERRGRRGRRSTQQRRNDGRRKKRGEGEKEAKKNREKNLC